MEKIVRIIFPLWVTPNGVSYFRAGLAIPILVMLLTGFGFERFVLYVFAAYLDSIDGVLARCRGLITELGSVVDALMDKVFYLVIFIPTVCLMDYREVNTLLMVLNFIGLFLIVPVEIQLGIIRWQDYKKFCVDKTKNLALKAGTSGKIKFVLEACGLGAYVLTFHDPNMLNGFFCWLGSILTIIAIPFAYRSLFYKLNARS